jgi:hypothetical protein
MSRGATLAAGFADYAAFLGESDSQGAHLLSQRADLASLFPNSMYNTATCKSVANPWRSRFITTAGGLVRQSRYLVIDAQIT